MRTAATGERYTPDWFTAYNAAVSERSERWETLNPGRCVRLYRKATDGRGYAFALLFWSEAREAYVLTDWHYFGCNLSGRITGPISSLECCANCGAIGADEYTRCEALEEC